MFSCSVPNVTTNSSYYRCCSGFCIDLLRQLSEKIGFDYELFEVQDKKWGAYNHVIITLIFMYQFLLNIVSFALKMLNSMACFILCTIKNLHLPYKINDITFLN